MIPASFNAAALTVAPSSNLFKSLKLITAYSVLNLALLNPLFGKRRYSGNCPPSNPALRLYPLLDFCPFSPLPEVFPKPLPGPRPTLLRFLIAPS